MNIKSFISTLLNTQANDPKYADYRVVIPASSFNGGIGATPAVDIKGISFGFDWDNGRIFIHPDQKLIVDDKETQLAKKFLHRCLSSLVHSKQSGDHKSLTRNIRNHFNDILKELDIEDNMDRVIAETKELSAKARHMRKIHATRNETLEE
jgi:hypothetical protein